MSEAPLLDVVIVNWNAGDLLREAVAALAASDIAHRLHVVVVDNASEDGSAERLASGAARLTLIRNTGNRGFGAACNQGAAAATAPAILFLNPDTRVRSDTLRLALDDLGAHAEIGILGVRQTDEAGDTLRTCARLPTLGRSVGQLLAFDRLGLVKPHFMTEWDHADTREVGQVMGAFLMIRRGLFERLGGFDERFFVYFEDVDLCARVQQAGMNVVHFAGASIVHHTQGTTAQVKDRRLFYYWRSQILYADKHWGGVAASLVGVLIVIAQVPMRLGQALLRRRPADAGAVLGALRMVIRDGRKLSHHKPSLRAERSNPDPGAP